RVAVEVGGSLLELGEVLDRAQRALRAEQSLDVHTAQGRCVNAVAEGLRADVPHQVRRGIGMAVGVTVEAGDATRRLDRTAILSGVELLLHELRREHA